MKAEILYYVATGINISLQNVHFSYEHKGSIHITKDVVLEHDNNKIALLCSSKWIQVTRALFGTSQDTKTTILRLIKTFSIELLTIINAVISIQHCDIVTILLRIIFNQDYFNQTYTYINHNDKTELLLCYSKFCSQEYDPYNISTYLINYFDQTHEITNVDDERTKAEKMYGPSWLVDPIKKLFLISIMESYKMITVGGIEDNKVSIFAYFVNANIPILNEKYISAYIKSAYCKGRVFNSLVKRISNVVPKSAQIHHKLINNKLC